MGILRPKISTLNVWLIVGRKTTLQLAGNLLGGNVAATERWQNVRTGAPVVETRTHLIYFRLFLRLFKGWRKHWPAKDCAVVLILRTALLRAVVDRPLQLWLLDPCYWVIVFVSRAVRITVAKLRVVCFDVLDFWSVEVCLLRLDLAQQIALKEATKYWTY